MSFQHIMSTVSLWILPAMLIIILTTAMFKKVPVYEAFTEGAKDGFKVAINIIPYLTAIIVGISMLRASGFIDSCGHIFSGILDTLNIPIDILPLMIVR